METMSSAVERLHQLGFVDQFLIEDGRLVAVNAELRLAADEVHVVQELRFDCDSDPASQSLVMALESADGGVRGTLCVPYGPALDEDDARVLRALAPRGDETPPS